MASKKDMRRDDLIISFVDLEKEKTSSASATLASSMPMAAMFMRNRMIGWTAVVFSVQHWLDESPEPAKDASPAYVAVGMSLLSLAITYLPLFLPPTAGANPSNTQAQAPIPPAH